MYDQEWHKRYREKTRRSALRVAELVTNLAPVASVVDFGCAEGVWLKAFADAGAERILGYDGPWNDVNALAIPRERVRTVDLSKPLSCDEPRFDLAVSLEVAEHLPPEAAETFVASITDHADIALFGAAIPLQGGFMHLNERWQSYWADLFASRGYRCFDLVRPAIWDDPMIHFWYRQNAFLFVRETRSDLIGRLPAQPAGGAPLDVIHPELFTAYASYEKISLTRMAPRLVGHMGSRALGAIRSRLPFARR